MIGAPAIWGAAPFRRYAVARDEAGRSFVVIRGQAQPGGPVVDLGGLVPDDMGRIGSVLHAPEVSGRDLEADRHLARHVIRQLIAVGGQRLFNVNRPEARADVLGQLAELLNELEAEGALDDVRAELVRQGVS